MGASKKIKKTLIDKDMTQIQFANAIGKDYQQLKNALSRDAFQYNLLEKWLDEIGIDIVFRDRATGKIID